MQKTQNRIDDRYRVVEMLHEHAYGRTLRCEGAGGRDCVLKQLEFDRAPNWKAMELFEREANALENISHRGVPEFFESFEVVDSDGYSYYIAREYIAGTSLASLQEELAAVALFEDEGELFDVARDLLEILDAIHSLNPPIVHRDVRPENIIRTEAGEYKLVGFGNVRMTLPKTMGGSTYVGTRGYTPMEQLMGKATPASDLYALGMTLIRLGSGLEPDNILTPDRRVEFQDNVEFSDPLTEFIGLLVETDPTDRPDSAELAIDILERYREDGESFSRELIPFMENPPPDSLEMAHQVGKEAAVEVRAKRKYRKSLAVFGVAMFLMAAPAGVSVFYPAGISIYGRVAIAGVWGLVLTGLAMGVYFVGIRRKRPACDAIRFEPNRLVLKKRLGPSPTWSATDIDDVYAEVDNSGDDDYLYTVSIYRDRKVEKCLDRLSEDEKDWVIDQISKRYIRR